MDEQFLAASDVIDWQHPLVLERAKVLAHGQPDPTAVAKACFEWVRDEIKHSADFQLNPVTLCASDVLRFRTVLLRQEPPARGIAAGERDSRGAVLPAPQHQ